MSGVMLLCAVLLLVWRGVGVLALQGAALALLLVWQALLQGSADFAFAALLAALGQAALAPWVLARLGVQAAERRGVLLLGLACVAVAIAAPLPAPREALAVALAVLLLGGAILATRRGTAGQAMGLVCAGNGAALLLAILPVALPWGLGASAVLLAILLLEAVVLSAVARGIPDADAEPGRLA